MIVKIRYFFAVLYDFQIADLGEGGGRAHLHSSPYVRMGKYSIHFLLNSLIFNGCLIYADITVFEKILQEPGLENLSLGGPGLKPTGPGRAGPGNPGPSNTLVHNELSIIAGM